MAPSLFPANPLLSPGATNRLSYPFGYWNAVGAWAAMSATLGLAFSAHDPHRPRRATTLALVPIAMATVYLTYSRASVVGAAVGAVLVLVLSRNRFTVFVHAIASALAGAGVILVIRAEPSIAHGTCTRGAGAVAGALVAAMVALGAVGWLTHAAGCDRARAAPWLRSLLVLVLAWGTGLLGRRVRSPAGAPGLGSIPPASGGHDRRPGSAADPVEREVVSAVAGGPARVRGPPLVGNR